MTAIRILRVLGPRGDRAGVLAFVDGHRVRWRPGGWDCACDDPDCGHVDAVADLLDPRVTGDEPDTQEHR